MEKSQQNKSPSSLTFIHGNLRAPSPPGKEGLISGLLRDTDTDGYPSDPGISGVTWGPYNWPNIHGFPGYFTLLSGTISPFVTGFPGPAWYNCRRSPIGHNFPRGMDEFHRVGAVCWEKITNNHLGCPKTR